MANRSLRVILTVFATQTLSAAAFTALSSTIHCHVTTSQATPSVLLATPHGVNSNTCAITSSRRSFLDALITTSTVATILGSPFESLAEEEKVSSAKLRPLSDCIYNILRVREATEQETRLISTGKFKDVQRANVKLAVKFMVINYRLSDSIIAASSYLSGNARMQASGAGQNAVQSLYTILEYFDSSDVENIKVGSDSMAGKESIVNKGLESVRRDLDDFLSYFPQDVVDQAKAKIAEENELNFKEFDPSLGTILNPNPK
ncbi:hypothetical protein ACHAXS_005015 [Conticribra weissflogii]